MNLRILKKLSKRAATVLADLGDHRQQFRAESHDNYTGLLIRARKHFERMRSPHNQSTFEGEIKRPAKDGRGYIRMSPPHHPRKGTVMVGAVTGYYEPEWDEETAWEALRGHVYWRSVEFSEDGVDVKVIRRLKTPSDYFRVARDLARDSENGVHSR